VPGEEPHETAACCIMMVWQELLHWPSDFAVQTQAGIASLALPMGPAWSSPATTGACVQFCLWYGD